MSGQSPFGRKKLKAVLRLSRNAMSTIDSLQIFRRCRTMRDGQGSLQIESNLLVLLSAVFSDVLYGESAEKTVRTTREPEDRSKGLPNASMTRGAVS